MFGGIYFNRASGQGILKQSLLFVIAGEAMFAEHYYQVAGSRFLSHLLKTLQVSPEEEQDTGKSA